MDIQNSKISILVVDDEESIVALLVQYLDSKGYSVTGLTDSREALDLINKTAFDVVFSDLMMPHVNGMDLVKAIRSQKHDTQIIIFTGYASVDSAIEAVQHGVYDYLKKPFHLDDLANILEHAIEKICLKRENLVLQEKIQKMLSQITMFYDISNIIYQVKERKNAIEMLFDTMNESMQLSNVMIAECRSTDDQIDISYASPKAANYKQLFKFTKNSIFNDQNISAHNSTVLTDIGTHFELDGVDITLPKSCNRLIFIPLTYQGTLDGYLIIIENHDNQCPIEDVMSLLKILATQIAPIIGTKETEKKYTQGSSNLDTLGITKELIDAEITRSEATNCPVSIALARLDGSGNQADTTVYKAILQKWRKMIAKLLDSDKQLYWVGTDTLLIMIAGGNSVGLDLHLADIRNELESGIMDPKLRVKLSMAYSIISYPFDSGTTASVIDTLNARLFSNTCELHQKS